MLPTAKYQMGHYVIIENLIIKQNHMKKNDVAKKKYLKKTEPENKTGLEKFSIFSHFAFRRAPSFGFGCNR